MIPYQEITGSSRAIGKATGRLLGPWLRRLVRIYPSFYRRQGRSYSTLRRRAQALLPPARRAFPEVIDEFKACASASRLRFEDVWFIATEEDVVDELEQKEKSGPHGEKCTSILLSTRKNLALVHNEDYDGRYRGMVAIQRVRPTRGPSFVRFLYPSGLPGTTCGANSHGIAFSEDSLHFPVDFSGVTKNVIFRGLLSSRSIADVISRVRRMRPSNGFALNVVSRQEHRAVVIERTPTDMAVIPVRDVLVHANNSLADGKLGPGEAMGHHSHRRINDVRRVLGPRPDTNHAVRALAQPGYVRSPYRGPKAYMTIATVAADFTAGQFGVKTWGPKRPQWSWRPLLWTNSEA